jgi:RNA polymerase sigma-70 factor (ECF subfamily)
LDVQVNERQLRDRLLRGLSGDGAAYQGFLQALAGLLRGFFRRRLAGLPDDVEDLVQETLLAVHNQRHTYEDDQPLTAWVYAIARYKMVDLLRRRSVREALNEPLDEAAELFAASESGEESHAAQDAKRDVTQLLETLPDRWRLPIVLVKLEGLSVAEAAAKTGMSESAVKVGVHRGLKALAAKMQGDG